MDHTELGHGLKPRSSDPKATFLHSTRGAISHSAWGLGLWNWTVDLACCLLICEMGSLQDSFLELCGGKVETVGLRVWHMLTTR